MKREIDYFKITSVHRDDLIEAGFDGNSVDDATMERLARMMSENYIENLFWYQIEDYANYLGIPPLGKDLVDGDENPSFL
jgi:hypothetical protein